MAQRRHTKVQRCAFRSPKRERSRPAVSLLGDAPILIDQLRWEHRSVSANTAKLAVFAEYRSASLLLRRLPFSFRGLEESDALDGRVLTLRRQFHPERARLDQLRRAALDDGLSILDVWD